MNYKSYSGIEFGRNAWSSRTEVIRFACELDVSIRFITLITFLNITIDGLFVSKPKIVSAKD